MDRLLDVNVEKKRHAHASAKFASCVGNMLRKLVTLAETHPGHVSEAFLEELFPENTLPKNQDYIWNSYSPKHSPRQRQERTAFSDSNLYDRTRTRTNVSSSQQLIFSRSKLSTREMACYDSTSRMK